MVRCAGKVYGCDVQCMWKTEGCEQNDSKLRVDAMQSKEAHEHWWLELFNARWA